MSRRHRTQNSLPVIRIPPGGSLETGGSYGGMEVEVSAYGLHGPLDAGLGGALDMDRPHRAPMHRNRGQDATIEDLVRRDRRGHLSRNSPRRGGVVGGDRRARERYR